MNCKKEDWVLCSPESEGLPSEKVVEFIQTIEELRINLHSFVLMRNGKVLEEGINYG